MPAPRIPAGRCDVGAHGVGYAGDAGEHKPSGVHSVRPDAGGAVGGMRFGEGERAQAAGLHGAQFLSYGLHWAAVGCGVAQAHHYFGGTFDV